MSTAFSALGSDAWLGANEYQSGDEFHTRATDFLATVKWDSLTAIASQHNNGVPCRFKDSFSIGHFNMARRLDFKDGTSWIARLRFPTNDAATDREALSVSRTMEIEIASMKFFRSKTSIPIPKVHAYSLSAENEAGAPYILMDYIHGSAASELRRINGSAPGLFGTPEQDQKFRQQIAQVQATVASFRFLEIGGLYLNEETEEFYIGPELQTGKGPWAAATDYYDDLTKYFIDWESKHQAQESQSVALPVILNFLQQTCGKERRGPFRLTNRDFGAHNILVNENFEIVGVIDFDGVMAAPIEAVAQYPLHCFLGAEPPGIVDSRPAAAERIAKTIPRLREYKSMLARCEQTNDSEQLRVSDCLGSRSASIFQGMMANQQHQDFVNDKWMKSCVKMVQWWAQGVSQNA